MKPIRPGAYEEAIMREETLAIVRRMQDNEATDQRVYAALAKQASLQKNSEILEKMSHDEGLHCAVWGRYTGIEAKADMFRVWLFVVLGKIFGLVFVINLMEGGEDDSAENYRKLMEELPEARSIMEDETRGGGLPENQRRTGGADRCSGRVHAGP